MPVFLGALALSIAFGLVHGSFKNIFVQGIGGLVYSIIFLKCGGFQRRFFKAIASSTLAHAAFNMFCAFMLALNGIREF